MSIKTILSAYDQQALIELGNEGLVRRATKLQEKGKVTLVSAGAETIHLQVGNQTVEIVPKPIQESSCDCSAVGMCVHILASVLFLQNDEFEETVSETAPVSSLSAREELLALSTADIIKWAGKVATRKAYTLLNSPHSSAIEEDDAALSIQFTETIKARYIAGGGLDGVICDASDSKRKLYVEVCLLYWLSEQGLDIAWPAELLETTSLSLSKKEMAHLETVRDKLFDVLRIGIGHITEREVDMIHELALHQDAYSLPHLNSLLLNLSGALRQLIQNGVEADSKTVLSYLTSIWILCEKLVEETDDTLLQRLRGAYRSEYFDTKIGPLWFSGAYLFSTKGGAMGLSVIGWDLDSAKSYSISVGRKGESARTFDPDAAFYSVIDWENGLSAGALMDYVVTLDNPKINEYNVLSQSAKTSVIGKRESKDFLASISTLGYSSWACLKNSLATHFELAKLPKPLFLRPKKCIAFELDEIAQEWNASLEDKEDILLYLSMPVNDANTHRAKEFNKIVDQYKHAVVGVTTIPARDKTGCRLMPVSLAVNASGTLKTYNLDVDNHFVKSNKKALVLWEKIKESLAKTEHKMDVIPSDNVGGALSSIHDDLIGLVEMGMDCNVAFSARHETLQTFLSVGGLDVLLKAYQALKQDPSLSNLFLCAYIVARSELYHDLRRLIG